LRRTTSVALSIDRIYEGKACEPSDLDLSWPSDEVGVQLRLGALLTCGEHCWPSVRVAPDAPGALGCVGCTL